MHDPDHSTNFLDSSFDGEAREGEGLLLAQSDRRGISSYENPEKLATLTPISISCRHFAAIEREHREAWAAIGLKKSTNVSGDRCSIDVDFRHHRRVDGSNQTSISFASKRSNDGCVHCYVSYECQFRHCRTEHTFDVTCFCDLIRVISVILGLSGLCPECYSKETT